MTLERFSNITQCSDSFIDSYRVLHSDGRIIWIVAMARSS